MVRCPATSCNQPFETEELRAFVDAEAFERWERLTLQKELDQMAVRDPFAQDTLFTPCSHLVHRSPGRSTGTRESFCLTFSLTFTWSSIECDHASPSFCWRPHSCCVGTVRCWHGLSMVFLLLIAAVCLLMTYRSWCTALAATRPCWRRRARTTSANAPSANMCDATGICLPSVSERF